jgi:hypothetical protein
MLQYDPSYKAPTRAAKRRPYRAKRPKKHDDDDDDDDDDELSLQWHCCPWRAPNVEAKPLYMPTYLRKKTTGQSTEDKENVRKKAQRSFDATTARAELMAKEEKEWLMALPRGKGKMGKKGKGASVKEWVETKIATPNLFEEDTNTVFLLHGSEKQQGATRIFDEEVVHFLKSWFPQYKGLWGDCTACFAEQASKHWGNSQQTISKILVIMFFATKRMFGRTRQRLAAVLRKNKTSKQAGGSVSMYEHCVQDVLHRYSNVRTQ